MARVSGKVLLFMVDPALRSRRLLILSTSLSIKGWEEWLDVCWPVHRILSRGHASGRHAWEELSLPFFPLYSRHLKACTIICQRWRCMSHAHARLAAPSRQYPESQLFLIHLTQTLSRSIYLLAAKNYAKRL